VRIQIQTVWRAGKRDAAYRLHREAPAARADTGHQRLGKAQLLARLEFDFVGQADQFVLHGVSPRQQDQDCCLILPRLPLAVTACRLHLVRIVLPAVRLGELGRLQSRAAAVALLHDIRITRLTGALPR
jgi:hypothetical protein